MSFDKRVSKGEQAAREVAAILQRLDVEYAVTGYELLQSTKGYVRAVTALYSPSSKALRFLPDFHIVIGGVCAFLEVKRSTGIEREAYEHYKLLTQRGEHVYLCFKRGNSFLVCSALDLQFKPMPRLCRWSGIEVPSEGVWRCPSRFSKEEYLEYKRKTGGYTSGSDFAFIDFDNMTLLEQWVKNI